MDRMRKSVAQIVSVSALHQLGISLLFAVYTVYLLDKGLTLFEAALVNTSYHLVYPLLEVPTGAIADTWGRKKSLLVSSVIWLFGSALYGLSNHLLWFMAAEITVALATAFGSGCFGAHIWDVVSDHGSALSLSKEEVEALNGKFVSIHRVVLGIVSALGGLFGAWLYGLNISFPWFASAAIYGVAFFVTREVLSEPIRRIVPGSFYQRFNAALIKSKESMQIGVRVRSLRRIAIINLIGGLAAAPMFMFWQPRILEVSGLASLGFAWVFIQVAVVVGKYIGGLINGRARSYQLISGSMFLAAVAAFVSAVSGSWGVVVLAFLVFETGLALNSYAIEVKNQQDITASGHGDETESNKRATLLSLNSMAKGAGSSVGLLIGGYLSQRFSIPVAWTLGSCAMLGLSITTHYWNKGGD